MFLSALPGFLIWFLVIYFVPLIVALVRHHRQSLAIGVLNVFLGWSGIGWVAALVWACTSDTERRPPRSG
jgi:ABC-type transport system involved in cytochrome c biogenesis permease component